MQYLTLTRAKALLEAGANKQIIVVGDVMLDEYIWGDVARISPEAPVPVVHVGRQTAIPGGAANVARNLSALGASATLCGLVGADAAGATLRNLLAEARIDYSAVYTDSIRPTTRKCRVFARSQQVVRIDYEMKRASTSDVQRSIETVVTQKLPECTALAVSDYAKGVVTPDLLERLAVMAAKAGKPMVLSPKPANLVRMLGATVIVNLSEAEESTGIVITSDQDLAKVGNQLLVRTEATAVIITRGKEGLSLFSPDQEIVYIPALAIEVFDTTGAGDTVLATVTLTLGAGATVFEAAELANAAAGCVVRHVGCAVPTPEEILATLGGAGLTSKVKTLPEMQAIVDSLKQADRKIVFTNGCFDLLHVGHVKYLEEARALGDCLIVGLNSNSSVRALKGEKRPLVPEEERARLLAALGCVDYVVIFSELVADNIIAALKPDIYVKGGDYRVEDIPETPGVRSYGGQVRILSVVSGKSSTDLMQRILERYGDELPGP